MARLIDADAVDYENIMCSQLQLHWLNAIIENQPTVDAVPVVRCKDCKHGIWDEDDQMWECIVEVDLTGDPDLYSMFHEYNDGMHFCSYGERRTE